MARNFNKARSDFNNDGFSDILWRNVYSDVGYWDMGNGGFVAWPVDPGGWHPPWAKGDYNGDGYADLVTRIGIDSTTTEWGLWESNPGSAPTWHALGTFTQDWEIRGGNQTDFTGDGTDDVLWFNRVTNELGFWEMQDGQPVHYQVLTAANNAGWVPSYCGDFNGDGQDDLLLFNPRSNETGIALIADGAAAYSGWVGLGNAGMVEETGDFTGDGSADIIFNNNGNLYLYDMQNGAVANTRYLGNFPGWDIVGGCAGDFTGDETEDVLWRYSSTGEVGYWDFNGGDWSTPSWVPLETVSDPSAPSQLPSGWWFPY